jgi:hypothetical protein
MMALAGRAVHVDGVPVDAGAPDLAPVAVAADAAIVAAIDLASAGDLALAPCVCNNPPIPAGWKLMQQSQVTTDMTNWAVMILHDPTDYPMFSTAMRTFGAQLVMARVEWHPPDFQSSTVHRGVTLYVPAT